VSVAIRSCAFAAIVHRWHAQKNSVPPGSGIKKPKPAG
jgi:hypothetical protein